MFSDRGKEAETSEPPHCRDSGPQRRTRQAQWRLSAEALCRLPLKEATEQFQRQYLDSLLAEVGGDTRSAAERAGYSLRGLQTILQRLRERG